MPDRSYFVAAFAFFALPAYPCATAFAIEPPAPKPAVRPAVPASADPIARLSGRWSGEGNVIHLSGTPESFKCIVTYRPASDGSALLQILRCQNPDYKFEAATQLQISGSKVTGEWEDKVNSLGGTVTGAVTGGGFDIDLDGRFFQAKMTVVGSACEQSVKLTPRRTDFIRELSASLKRC